MASRPIRIEGDIAYVPLTKGYEAVIDAADVPLVEGKNWRALEARRPDGSLRTVYAVRSGGVYMHRVLMSAPDGMDVDHKDGDGLNCRKRGSVGNLRLASRSQNLRNSRCHFDNASSAKGVCWHGASRKWMARIRADDRDNYIGIFRCKAAAQIAYAKESQRLHDAFGRVA